MKINLLIEKIRIKSKINESNFILGTILNHFYFSIY
jgi:hypothetical protein